MIVVIEKNENGKIEFTKEELEQLLEKARAEGAKEAQKNNYIYTTPSAPSITPMLDPYRSPFTCQAPQTVSGGTSVGEIKLNGAPVSNGI